MFVVSVQVGVLVGEQHYSSSCFMYLGSVNVYCTTVSLYHYYCKIPFWFSIDVPFAIR